MLIARYKEFILKFKSPAGTSRGFLTEKKSWFIILIKDGKTGIGECSLLPGLSPDDGLKFPQVLLDLCDFINKGNNPELFDLEAFPSINFGLEMALKDISAGGKRELFPSLFTAGKAGIPLNGLIWMGDKEFMKDQIKKKIEEGYPCIKIKVGALDFATELGILRELRTYHPDIEIRIDANGAFSPTEATEKLKRLSDFNIHSVEQPIKPGNYVEMAEIIMKSPVPVALDEELIGISDVSQKEKLIMQLKPRYIILKPGLIGGFKGASEWISIAENTKTGWWVTSALESNIGLNAIAQWSYTLNNPMVQGLGTGQLFENNVPSPLTIRDAKLYSDTDKNWNLNNILQND
jgi:o-succinylbenzoate synthase